MWQPTLYHFPTLPAKSVSGYRWNSNTYSFNITEAQGLYFVGLSVGPTSGTQVNYTLVLSGQHFGGITRTSIAHYDRDQMGHDFLIHVCTRNYVFFKSVCCNIMQKHSGHIFNYIHLSYRMVDSLVAFSVAREDSLSGSAAPFPFTTYLYLDGLHYDPLSHTFTAPSPGIYFFSFSVGLDTGKMAEFILYKN